MHLDVYEWILFKHNMMIESIVLYILICLIDVDLDSRYQECEKAIPSAPMLIWNEFGMLLRLGSEVGMLLRLGSVINLILILSCLFSIQGREPY